MATSSHTTCASAHWHFDDCTPHHSLLFVQQPGEQLTAKLTDFGMAKVRAAANNTTNIDTRKGTVAWQPPGVYFIMAHLVSTHCTVCALFAWAWNGRP